MDEKRLQEIERDLDRFDGDEAHAELARLHLLVLVKEVRELQGEVRRLKRVLRVARNAMETVQYNDVELKTITADMNAIDGAVALADAYLRGEDGGGQG